jgi:FKBP-type peptidyl-prolyl cis-trans isomerase 2
VLYTISEIYPEHVVLDGNHPLAGIALRLQLKVCAIREATVDEVGAAPQVPGSFAYSLRHRAAHHCTEPDHGQSSTGLAPAQ